MAQPALTAGAIARILADEKLDGPVLQTISCKKIEAANAPPAGDRYKVQLSDGVHLYSSCMLATQLNERFVLGELQPFAIIKVNKYLLNNLPNQAAAKKNRKVLVLVDFTELKSGDKVKVKIGNPQPFDGEAVPTPLSTVNAHPAPTASAMPSAQASASSNAPPTTIFPIPSLTPYQNKWTIRARVTNKTPIKTYTNSRGEGKLFSVDLADESGEIRATCFNKEVDKFNILLEPNGVYYISRGAIKAANKQYSSINNDYELTFNAETTITQCLDDSNFKIPTVNFNFLKINNLASAPKDKMIDVLGVVKSYGDIQTITSSKWGKEFQKRDLQLIDDSLAQVGLTLWGQQAVDFCGDSNPVIAVKGAKVSDFSGVSLGTVTSSIVQINPDIREAHALRGWYDSQGCTASVTPLSSGGQNGGDKSWQFMQLASIGVGQKEKADYFTVKGTVMSFKKEQAIYMSCTNGDCKKKVVDMANGMYRCEKCNKDLSSYRWRLMLQLCISDLTENMWISCFEDTAAVVLGCDSEKLGQLKERDPEAFDKVFSDGTFKQFSFRIRAKTETFNDESRLKYTAVTVSPVDYVEYAKFLQKEIAKLEVNDFT